MGKPLGLSEKDGCSLLLWGYLIVFTSSAWAGIPSGYYDSASGKTGEVLKSSLHNIIADHVKYPYTSSNTDVWDILMESDEDPNNSDNVILIYTGRSQAKSENAGQSSASGGDRWNREHVWAKSHGFPSTSDTAYTDCHHLRPADESVNSSRSNLDFDNGGSAHIEATSCNYDSDSWEPRDGVKGDVARMLFYMAVRYDPGFHSDNSEYDLEIIDSTGMDIGVAPGRPVIGKLSTLLAWHEADPVDSFESNRNEVVYSYQGNRNPFIDHPEYVDEIWGENDEVGELIITAVYDGPRLGGTPKGVELFVVKDISDLSVYGLGAANNGGGSDGQEFTFPAMSVSAGEYIYVASESTEFTTWFGSAPDFTSGYLSINGDDAIELFRDGTSIDVFGDINIDGNGEAWEYLDGWAYSKDNRSSSTSFNAADWTYSEPDALDGESTNGTATTPIPIGTYTSTDESLPVELGSWSAESQNGQVILSWMTESEIENQGFILSRNGTEIASFVTHNALKGQGSTIARTSYSFVDVAVETGLTYAYVLSDVDYAGNTADHAEISITVRSEGLNQLPKSRKLQAAYPNPFNPTVTISFDLDNEADQADLLIYDLNGTLVQTLATGQHDAGLHRYGWDGTDAMGKTLPAGIYLVALKQGPTVEMQRVTFLK